jgi:CheY-like chemotaxis protein/putative methionine-R-sulfoxide reductase with GAF domain
MGNNGPSGLSTAVIHEGQGRTGMILKGFIGEILIDLGYISEQELEKALLRQREIARERISQKQDQKIEVSLRDEQPRYKETTPMLGIILNYMGFATMEQVELAVEKQEKMAEVYQSLDSKRLGLAIELSSIINSTLNLSEVLTLVLRYGDRLLNSVASTLMLLDEKTGELVFTIPTGSKADKLREIRIPAEKGIAGWVAKRGKPVWVSDVREDPRFYPEIDMIFGFKTEHVLCVPVRGKTKLFGVLEVINKKDGTPFTKSDSLLLSIFAHYTALAIENARTYEDLQKHLGKEIETKETLVEYENSQALGNKASDLGHEFNNLLMNVQGNISLMLLETDTRHPNYKRLKSMEQSVQKGAEVTRKLLDSARSGGNGTTLNAFPGPLEQSADSSVEQPAGTFEKAVPVETPLSSKTILIVDDEEMILNVGKKMLEKMSHNVLAASSGKEAIKLFKAEKHIIDLVVLDMIMPEMGGKETFERIREINPDVKILISSGYSQGENTAEILARGGSGFIQKPFTMMELAQKIRDLFE